MIQNISSKNKISGILLILTIIISLKSCGIYRKVDAKDFPPEPEKRVQKILKKEGDLNFLIIITIIMVILILRLPMKCGEQA